ncbi:MAG: BMP family ABC transporter substrate-binding protein [Treponema sp. GWB1_62_6]|nr:MAG: BMP family ABC transporter substrate-binding protein [Treponema sp. GWC1_61_84]OHE66853.1 MAG: BMP family ABC transporter substrate-binding protein [Treponema sp. GWB1_62_6]HCM27835.1 BMP family ABC transporter substrate-binding protein [Treponema sp.]
MKKAFIIGISVAVALATLGCAKKAAPVAPAAAAPTTTVRLLTDATGIDDKSFNAAAWRGILDFYGDSWENQANKGKLYDVVTAQTQDLYVPNLKQASDEKYDLVIVTGFTWSDALGEVAPQYANQKYMIVDVDWVSAPNVMQVTFSEHEGSYLVGVAAALKAKADGIAKPKFGFIGGIPGPVITKFEVGYVQGIKSVLPDAEVVDYYANDWGKPELAKAQAKNWFDSGVYAIFSAAGGTGNGTIAQAKEYRSQGKNVWAIGVDSDQYEDGVYVEGKSAVLTSMLKRVETASKVALDSVKNGTFKAEVVVLDTKSEGVGFSAKNAELGADIASQVDAVKAKIISGETKVAATHAAAKALPGFPQNLQAKDAQ